MDRFEAAEELKEHVTAIVNGAEKQDENPVSLFVGPMSPYRGKANSRRKARRC